MHAKNKIPPKWKEFLKKSENKSEIFEFLSNRISETEFPTNKEIVSTYRGSFSNSNPERVLLNFNHEESDTCIIVHLVDGLKDSLSKVLIRTVDTDVIVILLGKYPFFKSIFFFRYMPMGCI